MYLEKSKNKDKKILIIKSLLGKYLLEENTKKVRNFQSTQII